MGKFRLTQVLMKKGCNQVKKMENKLFLSKSLIALTVSALIISGCNNNNSADESSDTNQTEISETKYSHLVGSEIVIRTGPGEEYEKLVNKKASEMLGGKQFCSADETFLVDIIDRKDGWCQIKTIKPEHLSETYNGWIEQKYIKNDNDVFEVKEIDPNSYDVILEKHQGNIINYYLHYKGIINEEEIKSFIGSFRKHISSGQCNVNLFDSKSIKKSIGKYPLEKTEYLTYADHFIANSTFDSPKIITLYPYQDLRYKELGGKNWKK
jgi:hypothetical protein